MYAYKVYIHTYTYTIYNTVIYKSDHQSTTNTKHLYLLQLNVTYAQHRRLVERIEDDHVVQAVHKLGGEVAVYQLGGDLRLALAEEFLQLLFT